jgi:hypothetical protein
MKRYHRLNYLVAFMLLPAMLAPQSAAAEGEADIADRLAGTWTLVSNSTHPGGPAMRGIKVVHADGRFALIMARPDSELAVASAAPIEGESAALPTGGIVEAAHGIYSLDPAAGVITFHVEASSFPNWEGMERRRDFRLQDGRWAYSSPLPDWSGTRELVWERLE